MVHCKLHPGSPCMRDSSSTRCYQYRAKNVLQLRHAAMRPIMGNTTSSTKLEVHNILQWRHRSTWPRQHAQKTWWSLDERFLRYVHEHTDTLSTIHHSPTGVRVKTNKTRAASASCANQWQQVHRHAERTQDTRSDWCSHTHTHTCHLWLSSCASFSCCWSSCVLVLLRRWTNKSAVDTPDVWVDSVVLGLEMAGIGKINGVSSSNHALECGDFWWKQKWDTSRS